MLGTIMNNEERTKQMIKIRMLTVDIMNCNLRMVEQLQHSIIWNIIIHYQNKCVEVL